MVITKLQFYRYCGCKCYKLKAKFRCVLVNVADKVLLALAVGRM